MQCGAFVWYELTTADPHAAAAFYGEVMGWRFAAQPEVDGITYLLGSLHDRPLVGVMSFPPDMPAPGIARWWGYVLVDDVDASAGDLAAAGGAVRRAPADIPGVGRFAVVADPQGHGFMLFSGAGEAPPELPYMTPGTVGWHELAAREWEPAFAFYAGLFGWEQDQAMAMPGDATYQILRIGGAATGAMMDAQDGQEPGWRYYFAVEDIDAALARVEAAGGAVLMGPVEVPGPVWIILATDPQGVAFALVGPRG